MIRSVFGTDGRGFVSLSERTQKQSAELSAAFPFLQFRNSNKTGPVQPDFVAPCVAPIDLDPEWAENHRCEGCRACQATAGSA
jgi:hypothetical protein